VRWKSCFVNCSVITTNNKTRTQLRELVCNVGVYDSQLAYCNYLFHMIQSIIYFQNNIIPHLIAKFNSATTAPFRFKLLSRIMEKQEKFHGSIIRNYSNNHIKHKRSNQTKTTFRFVNYYCVSQDAWLKNASEFRKKNIIK